MPPVPLHPPPPGPGVAPRVEGPPWRFFLFAAWLLTAGRLGLLALGAEHGVLERVNPASGIAYDVFALSLVCLARVAIGLVPLKHLRLALSLATGVLVVALIYGNHVYVSFFRTPMEPYEVGRAGNLPLVFESIRRLTTLSSVAGLLVVPIALLGWSALRESSPALSPRRVWLPALAILLSGVLGNWCGNVTRGPRRVHALRSNVILRWLSWQPGRAREVSGTILPLRPEWMERAAVREAFPLEPGSSFLDLPSFPFARHRGLGDRDARLRAAGLDVDALHAIGDRPNIVLVMLEGVRASEVGAWGTADAATPNLDALARAGLLVERFYANSSASIQGSFATQCSFHPNTLGPSYHLGLPDLGVRCLPEILRGRGYSTRWYYGYSAAFDEEGYYLKAHGVQEIFDQSRFPPEAERLGWGISDRALFDAAVARLASVPEPFSALVTTLSNHHPFTAPPGIEGVLASPYAGEFGKHLPGIGYTDFTIGRFMDAARKAPWFSRTLFVFVADHGVYLFPEKEDQARRPWRGEAEQVNELYFRVPLLFYAPAFVRPGRLPGPASQVDVLPTLLDVTATEADGAFVGYSVFQSPQVQRRILLAGLGGTHAIRGDVRCWSADSAGRCSKVTGPQLYGEFPREPTQDPELVAWAIAAAAMSQHFGRTNRIYPFTPAPEVRDQMQLDGSGLR